MPSVETLIPIENPFAADKASAVSAIIEDLKPKNSEALEKWGSFSKITNPNENEKLHEYTIGVLFNQNLVKSLGTESDDAIAKIVEGSPDYTQYRDSAAETYDFFGKLFQQGIARPEKISGVVGSFGSDSFPENKEQLAAMLEIPVTELPDTSDNIFLSMKNLDTTLKRANIYGEDTKLIPHIEINTGSESTEEQPSGASTAEAPVEAEVVFHQGEWLTGDIDDDTKKWLEDNGFEALGEDFTGEEKEKAESFGTRFREEAKNAWEYTNGKNEYGNEEEFKSIFGEDNTKVEEEPGIKDIFEELFDGEGDIKEEGKEAAQLLLRIAVKVSLEIASAIANEIAKDKDASPEARAIAGLFAKGFKEAGDFADRAITSKWDEKPNLKQDIVNFISDKYN